MRYLPLAFAVALSVSCGRHKDVPSSPSQSEALHSKAATYLSLLPSVQDKDGFIETDTCDSLLFSSLTAVGGGSLNIRAARDDAARWSRRPLTDPACYPDHSSSTISRDMLLGVLWYAYSKRDGELAKSLWDYGAAHSWIMGDGDRSLVFMPDIAGTTAQLLYTLTKEDHVERVAPYVWPGGLVGFEANIEVLHVLLRNRLFGAVEPSGKAALSEQAARQSHNALFQCGAGNTGQATAALLDNALFPPERLPTSSDHCDNWLYERDYGQDWLPCPAENRTHSGGELLYVTALLENGECG